MANQPTEPKQTNQGADGRKDEKKGTEPGRKLTDQHSFDQASPGREKQKDSGGGRNSAGGTYGRNKGGNDAHNKR